MNKVFNVIPGENAACILMYGNIGGSSKVNAAEVMTELMTLQNTYRKIDVRINSYGGEVFEGIAICNALRNSTAEINIYIDGIAASIASVIALCGKPLHMSKFARLMLHQVSGGAYGTAEEMRKAADEAESAQNTLAEIIAMKCKLTTEEVKNRYFSGGDHWITADEALTIGLIDSIYDIEGEQPAPTAQPDDIYNFTNRLNEQPQNTKEMLFDELKKHFTNVSTEAEMLAHIKHLENEAAKVPSLTARITELENEKKESLKLAHEALVNQAITEGRIREAQKESFMNLLASDEANAKAVINSLPKKTVMINQVINQTTGTEDITKMTWDELDKSNRLAELKNKHPEVFEQKFKEKFNK